MQKPDRSICWRSLPVGPTRLPMDPGDCSLALQVANIIPRNVYFPNSWTFGDCENNFIDDEGYEFSPKYNISTKYSWKKYIRTMAKNCGRKGVTMGGSKELSKKTIDLTIQFFRENL